MDVTDALSQAQRELSALRFDRACELAGPCFRAARDAQQWADAADAAMVLAKARGNQRRSDEALRWAHEALLAARQAERPDVACGAWIEIAREHALLEQGDAAQLAVDEVLVLVPMLQEPGALKSAYAGLAAVYGEMGVAGLAWKAARQALAYAEVSGDTAERAMARTNLLIIGIIACEQRLEPAPDDAAALLAELWPQLDQLRAEAPQVGTPLALSRLHRVAGALYACAGRWEEAAREFKAITDHAASLPAPLACSAWIERGVALLQLGRLDEAHACGEAAAKVDPSADPPRRAVELRRRSRICELTGRPVEALEFQRRYHDRRHHLAMTALQSRAAALSARIDEQGLRIENLSLRERNEALQAHVRDAARMASTDPLTGLLNRRGLEAAWSAIAALPQSRALALVDLDHFKRINDEHSHTVGDTVLRTVANLMHQALRTHDRLARHGGEEFAVLLFDLDLEAAHAAMERLREGVRAHDWNAFAPGIQVSVSVGVVAVRPGESLEAAAARADVLLYGAKRGGRDRVCSA